MDCSDVRADVIAYKSGNLADPRSVDVGRHLAECDPCMTDARDTQSTLALLKSIEEITPSPTVWQNIEKQVTAPAPARRAGSLRNLLRFAAAASFLVAALSFIYVATVTRPGHAATVSLVAPDAADLRPGKRLMTGEPFLAPTYVVLTLPDVGLLKLNRGTRVRFDSPTRVHLAEGELFAEVTRGFVVESRDATVTVHGTRFGIRADGHPSTVYVVEGKVEVAPRAGRALQLESGRMATVGGAAGELSEDMLGWIAPHERILLTLDAPRPGPMKLGDSPSWRIAFRTNSPAPMNLEPLHELPRQLYLKVVDSEKKEYVSRLGATVSAAEVRHSANGLVRLDVMTPCLLTYRVEPALFPAAGRYAVTLTYQGRQGVLQSDPITIEVR